MKIIFYILIFLSTSIRSSISKEVDKSVDCCLTNKETLIGKWNFKQGKKDIDIYFKWDGRVYLTDYQYSESNGIIKSHYVGEWNLIDDNLSMTLDNNTVKYQLKFDGLNAFSLISLTTVTTYNRVR